jgi:hypothetical protein
MVSSVEPPWCSTDVRNIKKLLRIIGAATCSDVGDSVVSGVGIVKRRWLTDPACPAHEVRDYRMGEGGTQQRDSSAVIKRKQLTPPQQCGNSTRNSTVPSEPIRNPLSVNMEGASGFVGGFFIARITDPC